MVARTVIEGQDIQAGEVAPTEQAQNGREVPPKSIPPPLKWAGGKRWLAPHLRPIWEPYRDRRLVEPFCGGLAVALGLLPDRALLNDINPHVIAFYRKLKAGFIVPAPFVHAEAAYYAARDQFNALIRAGQEETGEAAALFYYLNRTGYNGLCRFNRRGEFNVPFGRYKRITYTTDFSAYSDLFHRWDFTLGDFEEIAVEPSDVLYVDPPYDVPFTQYSKEAFGWCEQVRLAKWASSHAGPVMLSNQATERIVTLYADLGFTLRYFDAPRRISNTGDRTPAREVLALKGV